MTTTTTIHDLAAQFERLYPQDVDRTTYGNGEQTSGYRGHEPSDVQDEVVVGYYDAGGSTGHPVLRLNPADVAAAMAVIEALPVGTSLQAVAEALRGARVDHSLL